MEKERGYRIFSNHQSVSALGYTFLTEAVIYLLALHFGANNLQLGYLSGTIHLAGIGLFLLPKFIDGKDLKKVYLFFWFIRGISCIPYLFLPLLKGQPAVWLILIVYTLFCLFRLFGMAAQQPLVKSLLDPVREGKQLSYLNLRFNISSLVSRGISFGILMLPLLTGLRGYLLLICLGIILNTAAVGVSWRIPVKEKIVFGKSRSLIRLLSHNLADPVIRPILLIQWLFVAGSVFSGFIIPFLRKSAGLTPGLIFLYNLSAGLGAIAGNFFLGALIDKTGARPLVILNAFFGAALFLFWAVIPENLPSIAFLIPGAISGFLLSTGYNVTNRQIYQVLPPDDKVGFSAMNSFICAITALLAGLLGGWLADLGRFTGLKLLHPYSLTMAGVSVFFIAVGLISLLSPVPGSLSVRHTARLIMRLGNPGVLPED